MRPRPASLVYPRGECPHPEPSRAELHPMHDPQHQEDEMTRIDTIPYAAAVHVLALDTRGQPSFWAERTETGYKLCDYGMCVDVEPDTDVDAALADWREAVGDEDLG